MFLYVVMVIIVIALIIKLSNIQNENIELLSEKCRNDMYEDILRKLRGLATNVNQLAHQANRGGQLPLMYELYELEEEFNAFRNEVRQVWHSEKYENATSLNNQQIRKDKTNGNSESC